MLTEVVLLSAALFQSQADTLSTAIVSVDRGISVSRTDTLSIKQSSSVTDLLLQSPGLAIADNGGMAGRKTVNLRGLGSTHTAIYVDGIRVGEVQAGQPDLGMLDLDNYRGAVIDYAQNSVNFSTARPVFQGRPVAGRFSFRGGSFGTYLPQGRLDFRLSDKLSLSAHASGVLSKGNFKVSDGVERTNNDIRQIKTGLDLFGLTDGGDWMAKIYYNSAQRGTPGTTDWPSTDRQNDRNAFAQAFLRQTVSNLYSLNVSAKIAYDQVGYISEWGDSDYAQTEAQLNSSHKFRVCPWLDLSAVAEFRWDGLKATLYDASRAAVTAIAGAAFKLPRFHADLTVQYDGVFDKNAAGRNVVSPSAYLRFSATDALDFVAFARRAYRAPCFNELYYPGYGNPDLKPEDAWLSDLGIEWRRPLEGGWTLKAKVDGFYNYLTDKIISAPTEADPNIWLPYNVGEVRSAGLDADAGFIYESAVWRTSLSARYSFQNAEEVPYLSKHTVVVCADASVKGWTLNAVWNLRAGRRDSYGEMPDWNTIDIIVSKAFGLRRSGSLALNLACRNLADFRYELVTGYPMQGRSILGGIEYTF